MESLWQLDHKGFKNRDAFYFLEEQASYLAEETNGLVSAHFCPKRGGSPLPSILSISHMLTTYSEPGGGRTGKNASSFYNKKSYEFFITDKDNRYELAIFDLMCNDEYPITLIIDPTIASEAGIATNKEISCLEELQNCFSDMLKTNKVSYVIQRLLKLSQSAENNSTDEK